MSVSELFDSTYAGNPHDLISQPPGFAFSRYVRGRMKLSDMSQGTWHHLDCRRLPMHAKKCLAKFDCLTTSLAWIAQQHVHVYQFFTPCRTTSGQRTPSTNILVCKPKRPAKSLSEFLEVEGDNDLNGPYVDGQRPFVTGHNR